MDRNFKGIWIPKEIWLSKNLSLLEKVILVEIDSLDDEENGCYASNKYFADFFSLTNGRISQIINKLKEKGYINIEYKFKGKEIEKRVIKINRPPYPEVFNKLNRYLKNDKRVFNKLKGGYLENVKENNINNINNINNNINNSPAKAEPDIPYKDIVEYLNFKSNSSYKYTTRKTKDLIKARLNEGFTVDDFKIVIDNKCSEWLNTDMEKYLRPETLFGTKFESYLNQKHKITTKDLNIDISDF